MFECYKAYDLKRTAQLKYPGRVHAIEVTPRILSEQGWVEIDLSINDYYNEYRNYLNQHGIGLINTSIRKVPTFTTRLLILVEKVLKNFVA